MVETQRNQGDGNVQQGEIEITEKGLLEKIALVELDANVRVRPHRARANRWNRVAGISGWVAAFSAGIGGISVIAEHTVPAVVLAFTATAFATFTAVFRPAEKAAVHEAFAMGYRDTEDKMRNLHFDLTDSGAAGTPSGRNLAQRAYVAIYNPFQELTKKDSVERDPLW